MASNNLAVHLPLVEKMLEKVKDTESEIKWQHLLNLINAAERLSDDKIMQIEETIKTIRGKLLKIKVHNEKQVQNNHEASKSITKGPSQTSDKPVAKKKKKKKNDQARKLTIKMPSMSSPARERIPKLKISLSEIYRIKRLKQERKRKKKLRLYVIARGQSLKREIMTPAHNALVESPNTITQQEPIDDLSLNNEVPNKPTSEQNLIPICYQKKSRDEQYKKYNLKNCQVVVKKIDILSTSIEPLVTSVLQKKSIKLNPPIVVQFAKNMPILRKRSSNPETAEGNESSTMLLLSDKSPNLASSSLREKLLETWEKSKPDTHDEIKALSEPTSSLLSKKLTKPDSQSLVQKKTKKSTIVLGAENSIGEKSNHPSVQKKTLNTYGPSVKNLTVKPILTENPNNIEKPLQHKQKLIKDSPNVKNQSTRKPLKVVEPLSEQMSPLINVNEKPLPIKINNPHTISDAAIKFSPNPQEVLGYKTPPMITIPKDLIFPYQQNMILLNADTTMRQLRPWLKKSDHQKQSNICSEMINFDYCLASLFKCMASACSYYTNDSCVFHRHLRIHWENQPEDRNNYSQCPYCNFKGESSSNLIQHIKDEHGAARYQCPYCFYRSFDYQIVAHIKMYHPLKREATIKCDPTKILQIKNELCEVWKNFFKTCRTILCVVCKERFMNISKFQAHFNTHKVISSQCRKCLLEVNQATIIGHLKNCHGFGNLNCAYCNFGTDATEILKNHLANEHENKFMLFFDRINLPTLTSSNNNNNASKQLALKQFEMQLSKQWNIIAYDPALLRNANNVRKNLRCYAEIKSEDDSTPDIIEIL